MFIGHVAVGLASKRLAPRVPLGWLMAAPLLLDLLFLAGVWVYRSVTGRRDRTGTYGFGSFVVFLFAMYAGNIVGPPPPDEHMVAWFSLSLWAIPFGQDGPTTTELYAA